MIRRFGSGRLNREDGDKEDVTPMWGVANMADIMLVLAVGIMVALVASWNLNSDDNSISKLNDGSKELMELSENMALLDEESAKKIKNSGMKELGSIYMDPNTGKMYVIVEKTEGTEEP